MKDIMVFVETEKNEPVKVSLEVLAKAGEIAKNANAKLLALIVDQDADKAADICQKSGADKVIIVKNDNKYFENVAETVTMIAKKYDPSILLIGGTLFGKDLAPLVARDFETGCVTDVVDIKIEGENPVFTAPVYGGSLLNDVVVKGDKVKMASVRAGSFKKNELTDNKAEIIEENIEIKKDLKTVIKQVIKEAGEAVNLEEAEVVVVAGRGIGSKENFHLIEELAEVTGGVIGGTRPVTEAGWINRSQQVGQSGKIITPKLYIGVGVSGAIQHVSGITGSDYIVAVNKDEDAAIFEVADCSVVADAVKALPIMIEEIKKIKGIN